MNQSNTGTSAPSAMSPEVTAYLLEQARLAALGRTSSSIMHDIRNYLTVVSSAVQLIQMKMDFITPAEMNQRLEQVMAQVDRIRQTMDSVGQFSSRADGAPISVNPDHSVDNVLASLRRNIDRSGISINRSRAEGSCKIVIDAGLFEFVLLEIISRIIGCSPCPEMLIINTNIIGDHWEAGFQWVGDSTATAPKDLAFSIIELAVAQLHGSLTTSDSIDNYLLTIPLR